MQLAIGADHRGYELKARVIEMLREAGDQVLDVGTYSLEPCDYPDCARSVAEAVMEKRAERGVLICGSGAGVSVAANKFPGVRAAAVSDCYTARQCVAHDDVNVLCLGAGVLGEWLALEIVRQFARAEFSGAERHCRRLDKVTEMEREHMGE